ncbi:hypothetical protein [Tardiphaga sp. 803_E3_N1_3]|uniref:hypothetical protein n=1 Tax=Tardiphaga sp. 803_E3_N1_3 TaxID=3240785 RepID=UPI003F25123E
MAFIVKDTRNGRTEYFVIDEAGRVIDKFPDSDEGQYQALARVASKPRRGKIYIPMSSGLPDGFGIFCVIDQDNGEVFFIAYVPGRILGPFPTFKAARYAAFEVVEPKPSPPENKPPI